MSAMTDQREELRAHVQKNLELLNESFRREADERQAVKKNLADFHATLDERSKIINDALDKQRADDLAALDEQIEQLKNFLSQQTSE